MRKDLKKNKKGFTLVEIIVVLLIIGILLAITIPSIMGYVGKAKDAQLEADARTGFVGAQTIVAREVGKGVTVPTGSNADTVLMGLVNAKAVNDESGSEVIDRAACTISGEKITECMFQVHDSSKYVYFKASSDGKAGDTETTTDGSSNPTLQEKVADDNSVIE